MVRLFIDYSDSFQAQGNHRHKEILTNCQGWPKGRY